MSEIHMKKLGKEKEEHTKELEIEG